jgi:Big-like domain-containing protein
MIVSSNSKRDTLSITLKVGCVTEIIVMVLITILSGLIVNTNPPDDFIKGIMQSVIAQEPIRADDQKIRTNQDEAVDIKLTASNTAGDVGFDITGYPKHGNLLGVDELGSVTDKNDVVTYTPKEGFVGKDSFKVTPDLDFENQTVDPEGMISINIIPPNTSNPPSTHELGIKIHVEKNPINVGDKQTITVTAIDKSSNKIAVDSTVKGMITYPNGHKSFSDNDGKATYAWNIDPNSDPGTFKVSADVASKGYKSISDSTTFKVNNKGVHDDGGPPTNQTPNNPDITFNSTLFKIKDLVPGFKQNDLSPLLPLAGIGVVVIGGTAAYVKHKSNKSRHKGGNITVITRGGIE